MPFDIFDSLTELAYESFASLLNANEDIPCISLLIEPSFDENTLIQFSKSKNEVNWKRTIWDKKKDIDTTSSPILSLKFLSDKVMPSMLTFTGTTISKNVLSLFENLDSFKDVDNSKTSNVIVIDGCNYTLKILTSTFEKTFKWKCLPEGWDIVESFAENIREANRMLHIG